jgi:hypothetical protein
VARLSLGASCQAEIVYRSGSKCVPGALGRKLLVFVFGLGGISGSIYFSTFDPEDQTGYAQTFWETIPAVPSGCQIVGAMPYEIAPTDRRIYLFVRTTEQKLQFVTFNLETLDWSDMSDLPLPPGDPRYFEIVINQTTSIQYSPMLVIRALGDFFARRLSTTGTVWEDGDWVKFKLNAKDLNLIDIEELLGCVEGVLCIRQGGTIEHRFTSGGLLHESWNTPEEHMEHADAEHVGSVLWGVAANAWQDWRVEKAKSGNYYDFGWTAGISHHPIDPLSFSPRISDQFSLKGLRTIVPNSGGDKYASFAYHRQHKTAYVGNVEQNGLYLRLDKLADNIKVDTEPQIHRIRIAPRVLPYLSGQFIIPSRLEGTATQVRRYVITVALISESEGGTNRTFAEDAYFFVPLAIADALQRAGEYVAALDWYRTVYDYTAPLGLRKLYYGLVQEQYLPELYKRTPDWLLDPLDPHAIASTRRLAYTRFTLIAIIRCLLEFADAEYTRDTAETVSRARTLYVTALDLLGVDELKQQLNHCDGIIAELKVDLGSDPALENIWALADLQAKLAAIGHYTTVKDLVSKIGPVLASGAAEASWQERFATARSMAEEAVMAVPLKPLVGQAAEKKVSALGKASMSVLRDPGVEKAAAAVGAQAAARFVTAAASISGVQPHLLENEKIELPWLRQSTVILPKQTGLDFVLSADLIPVAPAGALSISVLLPPSDLAYKTDIADLGRILLSDLVKDQAPISFKPHPVNPLPGPSLSLCIPPNPLLKSLRMHAELNLHKLRTCRNIAGMKREFEPYGAPTDTVTGLPTIGAGGQLVLPSVSVIRPTLYRFQTLIQRAKELVQLAGQIEGSMLLALERRDAEAYSAMRARQDLELAQAQVQLHVLRLNQANENVTLAMLQRGRAQIQANHYQKLLDDGLLELEQDAIETLGEAANLQATAATYSFAAAAVYGAEVAAGSIAGAVAGGVAGSIAGPAGTAVGAVAGAVSGALSGGAAQIASGLSAVSQGYSSLAAKRSTLAQIGLTLAGFERRRQDWELLNSLASQDIVIGAQQVALATDGVEIANQEKIIADIRNTHARDAVEFLTHKFTNVELFEWMSGVLEDVYGFFLQQATATAKLAENQLAFERQEPSPAYIQADYWTAPGELLSMGVLQNSGPDRRGLTGSARLLQDVYRLDQYAFETNKRKHQLTKTISLAQIAPVEFQRFRETGVITVATPMEILDREFPGHYLRLIKRVRTSVVALISPTYGIRATLANAGLSRTVIGPNVFQTVPIRRDPESVALTSPINATGLFELESQTELLYPFEGCGVDTIWEFQMQRAANPFDYGTIADVLIAIDYTALSSNDYYQQVSQKLRPDLSLERPFSFRGQFADQWYDLHNPDQTSQPMTVRFRTAPADFAPNLNSLKIQHVALYFARAEGQSFEVPVTHLRYTEQGSAGGIGGGATSIDGFISTRRGNAGSWTAMQGKSPFGEWELSLPDTDEMRNRFKNEEIVEMLFVLSYSGRTPAWVN